MRYIGNKNRLINKIDEFVKNNITEECSTFCDLFAGTGSIGLYFKNKYNIISNDYMYFSYILNKGLLDYNDLVEIRNVIDKQLDEWDNK